jgi:hypothetical protein
VSPAPGAAATPRTTAPSPTPPPPAAAPPRSQPPSAPAKRLSDRLAQAARTHAAGAAPTPGKSQAEAAKPEPDVPVLTIEFDAAALEPDFVIDLDLSEGQIDDVLTRGSPDVPVLTDSVELVGDEIASAALQDEFDEETQHKLANLAALAQARALEDISNSMAETLFGDAELDELAATLAVATGKRDERDQRTEDDVTPRPAAARAGK